MELTRQISFLSRRDTIDSVGNRSPNTPGIPKDLFTVLESQLTQSVNWSETACQYMKILQGLSSFKHIDEDIYWYLWKLMLYLEQYQGIVECRNYALSRKKIQMSSVRSGEFLISVPGLSEDRPSLRPKDQVHVTRVDDTSLFIGDIQFVGEQYIAVSFDNCEFAATYHPERLYDIKFCWSQWENAYQHFVLDKIKEFNLMRVVFPIGGKVNNASYEKITWINKAIEGNAQQQQAIRNILHKTSQPDPYILFGPPGTGKTSTLIEAILQIQKRSSSTRILICTPSNSAADEIALKLQRHCPDIISENALFRMYSASKKSDDVHELIKGSSNMSSDEAVFLSKELFMRKKIVIVTLATAARIDKYGLKEDHFGYLFIDEAGQATELQTLIPLLTLCGGKPEFNGKLCGQVVIAGDPQQLGPCCDSKLAEPILSRSMLERLMSWGPYRRSESTGYDPIYVTKLVQNFRCHPAILHIPNKLFYDGELIPCGGDHTLRALDWFYLPKKKFPVMFHAVKGEEQRETYSPSVYNPLEVKVIVDYVKKLIGANLGGQIIKEEEVGIVTPYKLQKQKLMQALAKAGFKNISVGTVEIFQGQERDVIIISTVRSVLYRRRTGKIHIGFLSNPKRFNVAVTRAKSLLIVVGNPEILQHDECWKEFMQYCLDNVSWCGPRHLLDKFVSSTEIAKLLGKKHVTIPRWDPNSNLPVVEDLKSANDYKAGDEETTVRRRRLPVDCTQDNEIESDSSEDGSSVEEVNDWPEHDSGESSDYYENDEPATDGEDEFHDSSTGESLNREEEEEEEEEEDGLLRKLRKRMEELEISSSSNNSTN